MTITEECTQNEEPFMLQLWENRDGKIWIQCGYDEMEPHGMHGIAITPDDARALIAELTRLVKEIESVPERNTLSNTPREVDENPVNSSRQAELKKSVVPEGNNGQANGEIAKPGGDRMTNVPERNNAATLPEVGLTRKQSSAFQQIADVPEERPGQGKQLSISKVNWG